MQQLCEECCTVLVFTDRTYSKGFPHDPGVNNLSANAGDSRDMGLIPGLGRSSGEGNGNPGQYLVWVIQWTEEPGGLQSMGSQSWT